MEHLRDRLMKEVSGKSIHVMDIVSTLHTIIFHGEKCRFEILLFDTLDLMNINWKKTRCHII